MRLALLLVAAAALSACTANSRSVLSDALTDLQKTIVSVGALVR